MEWNYDWAMELLEQGKINIVLRGERKIVVSRVCKGGRPFSFGGEEGLKYGDIIARQIMDGDPAFLNRQPTLKDSSIQGVALKLVDEVTHQLPLASCRPLNADFDGL
jgi:DNA-directed RNA polymerase beta' subunit